MPLNDILIVEVEKRPIIYDKRYRTDPNYLDKVQIAYAEVGTAIDNILHIDVPISGLKKIWESLVSELKTALKKNRIVEQPGGSKAPRCDTTGLIEKMKFLIPHLMSRDTISVPLKSSKSVGKINKAATKKEKVVVPPLDDFAQNKMEINDQIFKAFNTAKDMFEKASEATNSAQECSDSPYFTILYDKFGKLSEEDVDKCFDDILMEMIDFTEEN